MIYSAVLINPLIQHNRASFCCVVDALAIRQDVCFRLPLTWQQIVDIVRRLIQAHLEAAEAAAVEGGREPAPIPEFEIALTIDLPEGANPWQP